MKINKLCSKTVEVMTREMLIFLKILPLLFLATTAHAGVDFSMLSKRSTDINKEKILKMVIEEHKKRLYEKHLYEKGEKKDRRGAVIFSSSIPVRFKDNE